MLLLIIVMAPRSTIPNLHHSPHGCWPYCSVPSGDDSLVRKSLTPAPHCSKVEHQAQQFANITTKEATKWLTQQTGGDEALSFAHSMGDPVSDVCKLEPFCVQKHSKNRHRELKASAMLAIFQHH